MTGLLANTHLWNIDGVCTTHKGMCGKVPFVPDKGWKKTWDKPEAPVRRIPTLGAVMARNRELIAANARCNQRNERQSEYIQFLHNWFKREGLEVPKAGGGK